MTERNQGMKDYTAQIADYITMEQAVLKDLDLASISTFMNLLENARKQGRRIFICGNGGSAATASHFASDFNKGVNQFLEKKYDFECLNDNIPMLMAVANDISYDDIFVVPLQSKLRENDLVIGISGSGNSENIVKAFAYAKAKGAKTIGIVGYDGGRVKGLSDHTIHICVENMQIAEDLHLIVNHMMMYILCHEKEA